MVSRAVLSIVVIIFILVPNQITSADDTFENPIRLQANGKIIDTGAAWGHSSPCIEDIDGDGLKDLIVGDFGGQFQIYKNVGKPNAPLYEKFKKIQADGKDASVRIYCCVGGQPRFVDLNGDGIRDFISSSYDPGHCYYFRGLRKLEFSASKELVDKSGIPVRSSPIQKQDFQSFGSFFTPVDWDSDGDFDILIGCFDGNLKLRINEGDRKKPLFASENQTVNAGDKPLKVKAHCCPVVADWDSDGLWDILAGSDDGSVTWFRNIGSSSKPQFTEGEILIEKYSRSGYNLLRWTENDIVPGIRSQIEVVDHNGDGKLDLILGDFCTAYDLRKDLTDKEKKELKALITRTESVGKKFADKFKALRDYFAKKYPGDKIYSDEATAEWSKKYKEIKESPEAKEVDKIEAKFVKQMLPFLASTKGEGNRSFDLAKSHGYVWLFLRK